MLDIAMIQEYKQTSEHLKDYVQPSKNRQWRWTEKN